MRKDKEIEILFKEINKKPENFDNEIMANIYREVRVSEETKLKESENGIWIYVLISILFFSGLAFIFYYLNISFKNDMLLFYLGLVISLLIAVDKICFQSLYSTRDSI